MNWYWLGDAFWKILISCAVGMALGHLWTIARSLISIRVHTEYLPRFLVHVEQMARSLDRIARSLETLAANSRTYVALRRQRGN